MSRGRLRILRVLGAGRQGVVYLAEPETPSDGAGVAAIKWLRSVSGVPRALRDEVRARALVQSPGVARVEGIALLQGSPAIRMQPVNGVSLARLRACGALPLGVALELTAAVAAVLHGGAQSGPAALVHGDLRAGHVLLEPSGSVRLIDAGAVWGRAGDGHGWTGAPPEAPPEGGPAGAAGDVFALGMLLAELVLGQAIARMWPDPETWDVRTDALAERVAQAAAAQHPPAGPPLWSLLRGMLQAAPDRRPSARDVDRELLALRGRVPSAPLARWAGPAIAAAADAVLPVHDPLVGQVVEAEDEPEHVGVPARPRVAGPSGDAPHDASHDASHGAPTPRGRDAEDAPDGSDPDEVMDPAEVTDLLRSQGRGVRPTVSMAAASAGGVQAPAPFDPSATFVGARETMLTGLIASQDTEIRRIPKVKRAPAGVLAPEAAPAPPPLPGPAVDAEPPALAPLRSPDRSGGPLGLDGAPLPALPPPPEPPAARQRATGPTLLTPSTESWASAAVTGHQPARGDQPDRSLPPAASADAVAPRPVGLPAPRSRGLGIAALVGALAAAAGVGAALVFREAAPQHAHVVLSAERPEGVRAVRLEGAAGPFGVGSVPAGVYDVVVDQNDGTTLPCGARTLAAGDTLEVVVQGAPPSCDLR